MRATLILGGGPGGMGPLIHAAGTGALDSWLEAGVMLVERGETLRGTLGRYLINSDSLGGAYLECLQSPHAQGVFGTVIGHSAATDLAAWRNSFPPLALVDAYLSRLGGSLRRALAARRPSGVLLQTQARAIHLRPKAGVLVELEGADGKITFESARTVVVALGGRPLAESSSLWRLPAEISPDTIQPERVISSDRLLTAEGLDHAAQLLAASKVKRVVVIGGSHSAFSSAWVLTRHLPRGTFAPGGIVLLARGQPRIFYESLAAAAADGYAASEADVCPRTERVNRFAGLRGDGREMWRSITRRPGATADPRIELALLDGQDFQRARLQPLFDEAALIVLATGYRSRTVPVYDQRGNRLQLMADQDGPAAGPDARLLQANGEPLDDVFSIGLGNGFRPSESMGGEPSFAGQANSLWLYQNDIGAAVWRGVRESTGLAAPNQRWTAAFDQLRASSSGSVQAEPVEVAP